MVNCTKNPRLWQAPASTFSQHPEIQTGKPGRTFFEARGGGSARSGGFNEGNICILHRRSGEWPAWFSFWAGSRDQFSGPWLFSTAEACTSNSSSSSSSSVFLLVSGCLRALAKGTTWAGLLCNSPSLTRAVAGSSCCWGFRLLGVWRLLNSRFSARALD